MTKTIPVALAASLLGCGGAEPSPVLYRIDHAVARMSSANLDHLARIEITGTVDYFDDEGRAAIVDVGRCLLLAEAATVALDLDFADGFERTFHEPGTRDATVINRSTPNRALVAFCAPSTIKSTARAADLVVQVDAFTRDDYRTIGSFTPVEVGCVEE